MICICHISISNPSFLQKKFSDFSHFYCIYYLIFFAFLFRYKKQTRKALQKIDCNILFWDSCYFAEYKMLNAILKKSILKNVFFWNPLTRWSNQPKQIQKALSQLKKNHFHFFTFDFHDSEFYQIQLVKNVNRKPEIKKFSIKQDFYFVGKNKGRKDLLQSIQAKLSAMNFSTKFFIIENKESQISPYDNILYSAESKCILDLVSENQTGLSLRPFDALFLKKKLVTNNEYIKHFDFYNPANIYIIHDNKLDHLKDFMQVPYQEIPENIVNQYEINQWIKNYYL